MRAVVLLCLVSACLGWLAGGAVRIALAAPAERLERPHPVARERWLVEAERAALAEMLPATSKGLGPYRLGLDTGHIVGGDGLSSGFRLVRVDPVRAHSAFVELEAAPPVDSLVTGPRALPAGNDDALIDQAVFGALPRAPGE